VRAAGSDVTASTAKPEEKRLSKFARASDDQAKSRVKPTPETKICAQFKRPMPDPRHYLQKWLDWDPEQLQTVTEGNLLGVCQSEHHMPVNQSHSDLSPKCIYPGDHFP